MTRPKKKSGNPFYMVAIEQSELTVPDGGRIIQITIYLK